MRRFAVLTATLLLVAGCGAQSEKEQVASAAERLGDYVRDHRWGDFCAGTTNPDDCEKTVATAEAMGIDLARYVPSKEAVGEQRVTVDGDHATLNSSAARDAEYVRRDGKWLFVWRGR